VQNPIWRHRRELGHSPAASSGFESTHQIGATRLGQHGTPRPLRELRSRMHRPRHATSAAAWQPSGSGGSHLRKLARKLFDGFGLAMPLLTVPHWRGKPVKNIGRAPGALDYADQPRHLTPHVLRHTRVKAGWPGEEVADAAGITIETVDKVYWHRNPHFQKRAA
jgi:integrase